MMIMCFFKTYWFPELNENSMFMIYLLTTEASFLMPQFFHHCSNQYVQQQWILLTYNLMYRRTSLGSPALLKMNSSDITVMDRCGLQCDTGLWDSRFWWKYKDIWFLAKPRWHKVELGHGIRHYHQEVPSLRPSGLLCVEELCMW